MKSWFIKATEEMNTFEQSVPAYYFRRVFDVEQACVARITVAARGFYEILFNGQRITRGLLSPYISNPNHYVYFDTYDVTLNAGKNVIGILLGNGFQNNPGGHIWDFDKADFRSAPSFALTVTTQSGEGEVILLHSDESFRIAPSPIRGDDYRFGEYYDATYEIPGWEQVDFDDSAWAPALLADEPKGALRQADVAPIVKELELKPVEIIKTDDGYIYDFGMSNAGVCRLCVKGARGQKIELRHADSLLDGDLNIKQIWFKRPPHWERDEKIVHCDVYVCKGEGTEFYQPSFTYHGFRYVKVTGITEEQATKDLLTYLVYHTALNSRGDFECSHSITSKLQEMTRRSILSNFHHFPTDCPQREKNGWTADAALTTEAALLNFDPERNYREWQRNICKAQREDGALPGIVPTGGWGFQWGNGPAWDCVLAYLPYYVYQYRGEKQMIAESAPIFLAYLRYLRTRCDENGLLAIGLGDWCHVGGIKPKAPLIVTDSIISMDIANKMAVMLDAVNRTEDAEFARGEARKYREAIRAKLIDFETMHVLGDCQSSQAMALHYGIFEESEREKAFAGLLDMIHACDDHMDVGVLGGRVIFHVLTEFGYSDLAFHMITREDYPSYGNWISRGATTLWEDFRPDKVSSMNHHFWGDISAWFIKRLAGIQVNPTLGDVNTLTVKPSFIAALDRVSAYHVAPAGKIAVSWKRSGEEITLTVEIPHGMHATAELEPAYCFADGTSTCPITTGTYKITRRA